MTQEERRKIAVLAEQAHTDSEWGYDYEAALACLYVDWPSEHWEEVLEKPPAYTPGPETPESRILRQFYAPALRQYCEASTVLWGKMRDSSMPIEGQSFTIPLHTRRNKL